MTHAIGRPPKPPADVTELCDRLAKVNPWHDLDWPEVIRAAAAALSSLSTELAEEQARCHDNRLIADAAYERAEKAEAALAAAQLYSRMLEADHVPKSRLEKAEAALAVEQAQVLAALQERDDLAVALERRGEAVFGQEGD